MTSKSNKNTSDYLGSLYRPLDRKVLEAHAQTIAVALVKSPYVSDHGRYDATRAYVRELLNLLTTYEVPITRGDLITLAQEHVVDTDLAHRLADVSATD